MEANIHLDVLSLFWTIWSNPQTSLFKIVRYILMMTDNRSLTWAAPVRILCLKYNLPDPLQLLDGPLWPKLRWKNSVHAAVISHHEGNIRRKAVSNSKPIFFHCQLSGLSGRPRPVLFGVHTAHDVTRLRPHLKMHVLLSLREAQIQPLTLAVILKT